MLEWNAPQDDMREKDKLTGRKKKKKKRKKEKKKKKNKRMWENVQINRKYFHITGEFSSPVI